MTLHVEILGRGPDLALLHGWGMHGGVWHGAAERLAQDFRLHVVDLPGYGTSDPCHPYLLEDVAQVLAHALPTPVAVCGWSLGAQAALAWALRAPQQVGRLVLTAATPCFTRRPGWVHGMEPWVFDDFARTLEQDYEGTLRRFLSLQARSGERAREVMARLRTDLFARGRPSTAVLRAGLRILLEGDLRSRVAGLNQPTLLVQGDRDTLVPLDAARWLAGHLPHARLEVVHGAAHAPFLSHEEAFIECVTGFLNE